MMLQFSSELLALHKICCEVVEYTINFHELNVKREWHFLASKTEMFVTCHSIPDLQDKAETRRIVS